MWVQTQGEGAPGASPTFQGLLLEACTSHQEAYQAFMNRLLDTLNWTATDYTVALRVCFCRRPRFSVVCPGLMCFSFAGSDLIKVVQEVLEGQHRGRGPEQQSQRRCALMFELSMSLLRLLEFTARHLPGTFLAGSPLTLTRLVELVGFVVSHLVGDSPLLLGSAAASDKLSRPALLAPIVGKFGRRPFNACPPVVLCLLATLLGSFCPSQKSCTPLGIVVQLHIGSCKARFWVGA